MSGGSPSRRRHPSLVPNGEPRRSAPASEVGTTAAIAELPESRTRGKPDAILTVASTNVMLTSHNSRRPRSSFVPSAVKGRR